MKLTLALDIGTSSIGWALVDEEDQKIVKTGVRVFPGAAENAGTGREKYRNVTRRESRQIRRQTFRRKQRRVVLLEALVQLDMCPVTKEEVQAYKQYRTGEGQDFPHSAAFKAWITLNPYALRDRALQEDITRHELGRIFYHIIHHRGFKTGRKVKEEGKIYEGIEGTTGIDETAAALKDGKSLGQYLYEVQETANAGEQRPRGRYTLRSWYIEEFNRIWDAQAAQLGLDTERIQRETRHYFGKEGSRSYRKKIAFYEQSGVRYSLADNDLIIRHDEMSARDYLGDPEKGILFYQKPLKSQRHLLGHCRYEKDKKVCHNSHPEFEYYRALSFVNNIEYGAAEKLTEEERRMVMDKMMSSRGKVKMAAIKKTLGHLRHEIFNYQDDAEEAGCSTIKLIRDITGDKDAMPDWTRYERIWNYLLFYEDADKLQQKLEEELGRKLKEKEATLLEKSHLSDDYASLSLKALHYLIPFLEKGMVYSDAVIYGGIRRAMGSRWAQVDFDRLYRQVEALKDAGNRDEEESFTSALKRLLKKEYSFSEQDCNHLYHHSQEVVKQEQTPSLPALPNLRNPIVQQALQELRTIVNHLSKSYLAAGQGFDKIKIEMARELKLPKKARQNMENENRRREELNENAKSMLREFGFTPSRVNIQKYKLYKEISDHIASQSIQCPYTGKSLSLTDIFGDKNRVQVEHIVPYSISLNDSLTNKTLCLSEENGKKGEKTPYQFYGKDPERWEEVKSRAFSLLPYEKAKHFTSTEMPELGDFLSRQLNDTRYISKKAKEYLNAICDKVYVFPGDLTAKIRRMWGLNGILAPPVRVSSYSTGKDCWVVSNDQGEITELYEKECDPPSDLQSDEMLAPGELKGKTFTLAPYFTREQRHIEIENDSYDGKGWMVYRLESIESLQPAYNELPKLDDGHVWIRSRARVSQQKKCTLSLGSLDTTMSPEGDSFQHDKLYWVAVQVKEIRLLEKGDTAPKNSLTVKRVKVRDGKAEIWIDRHLSKLPVMEEDGTYRYSLSFVAPSKESKIIPNEAERPDITDEQLILRAKIGKDGVFSQNPALQHVRHTWTGNASDWVYAVVNCSLRDTRFYPKYNPEPKKHKGKIIIEGHMEHELERMEPIFVPRKSRMDHRHHAVDALTIACMHMGQLQQLSRYNARMKDRQRYGTERPQFDPPWEDFRKEAEASIKQILVVHRQNKDVLKQVSSTSMLHGQKFTTKSPSIKGQLHKETIYGKRKRYEKGKPEGEYGYHVRKSLADINSLRKIADTGTKDILKQHLASRGHYPDAKETVKKEWFTEDIRMPGKNGNPIKKVRVRESLEMARQWHEGINQYVNPRNNHALVLYEDAQGEMQEHVIVFWDAVKKRLQKKNIYALPDPQGKLIATLHINDFFLIGLTEPSEDAAVNARHLYRVRKLSSMYYVFCLHTEASLDREFAPYQIRIQSLSSWKRYNPVKVSLTAAGEIARAREIVRIP